MDEKNKLMLQMGIFFIIVLGIFTYIILNEKKEMILTPKIEEKLLDYIDHNYATQKIDFNIGKIEYDHENRKYQIKINNTKNKNLYFYVNYQAKKITDTYQKDYVEGNSLYESFKNEYTKYFKNASVSFAKKLNDYPTTISDQIIYEDAKSLPIYNIKNELTIKNHSQETILNSIKNFYYENIKLGYHPKEYTLTIVDKNDLYFAIEIENLTEELITNNLNEIIHAIIEDDSNIKTKYSINYKYIN